MLRLKYPSKDFRVACLKAASSGEDFCVDAPMGRITRRSVKYHIDAVFGNAHRRRRFGSLAAALFAGDIMVCIGATTMLGKKYDAEYSETGTGLLITFWSESSE